MIQFFAEGTPKGQPRPKAFSRGGHARVYDPGTAEGWKGQVAIAARQHIPKEPLIGPLFVSLLFKMPRPKGHYGSGKKASILKDGAPGPHIAKPDCDNLAKAVLDALTELGMWRDDSQVYGLNINKSYAEKPGCNISIQHHIEM